MAARTCLAIVLAAGEGTRMRSALPKVLHAIAGRSLLAHVLTAVAQAQVDATAVVVGPGQEAVAAEAQRVAPGAQCFVQETRRGTADAVLAARAAIEHKPDDILIVYGDTPLIRAATLARLRAPLAAGAAVAVLGFQAGRSDRLRAAHRRRRQARRHPRRTGRQRQRARDRFVQRRNHGACGRADVGHSGADRQPQPQGRILSDRCGRDRARPEARCGRGRSRGGRCARHQHQKPARRSGSGSAAASASGGARCRRHPGRAGDRVSLCATPSSARMSWSNPMSCLARR